VEDHTQLVKIKYTFGLCAFVKIYSGLVRSNHIFNLVHFGQLNMQYALHIAKQAEYLQNQLKDELDGKQPPAIITFIKP